MFQYIARIILRNRLTILFLLLILTSFMAFMATKIEMSYEPAPLLPKKDSTYKQYAEFTRVFGEGSNLIVYGIESNEFFQPEIIGDWVELGNDLRKIEGVNSVFSITDAIVLKKNSKQRRFEFETILSDSIDLTQLDSIKALVKSLPVYKDLLYNEEGVYLMGILVDKDIIQSKQRNALIQSVENRTNTFSVSHKVKDHYSGLPYIRTKTANKIKSEMLMFIALAGFVVAVILYMFFRSFRVVFFSLIVVAIAVVWVFGFMSIMNFKITTLTAVIPPVLIVIGIPNCIFLLNKYHHEFKLHSNQIKALQRVIQKIGNATFLTNLTTASGFATFMFTQTRILREFGMVASVNILVVFTLSITLIPIIFSFLPPPVKRHTKHLDNKRILKLMDILVNITRYHRKKVYLIAAIALIIGFYEISKIQSTGYMVDDLPKHDPVLKDLQFFESNFNGLMPLEISINTKKPKLVLRNNTIKLIAEFEDSLSKIEDLSRPVSVNSLTKFARQAYYNNSESAYKMPSASEHNFILSYLRKDHNRSDMFNSYVDSTAQITRLSYRVNDIGTSRILELENKINELAKHVFKNTDFKVQVTGASIISAHGNSYLVDSLFISLLLAVLLISSFMAWMFTSWRMVFFSLIPNLFPLIITAAFMGYFGIPIKPSTVLIFSIAFGISVDDTIHYLAKYRQELRANHLDIRKSVTNAIRETGVSMFYTSIVLFFGFGIFTASDFGGTAALGILVAFTLLVAMTSNLVLLPSLLMSYEKIIISSSFKEPLLAIFDEEEDIDLDELKIKKVKLT